MNQENNLFNYYGFTQDEVEKHPTISGILKNLTIDEINKVINGVDQFKLPKNSRRLVDKYEKVGQRIDFIWKWTYLLNKKLTLSSVPRKTKDQLLTTKLSTIIINALVDDIADERKNKEMWEASFNIFFNQKEYEKNLRSFTDEEVDYLKTIGYFKEFLLNNIENYPNYNKFKEVFYYDYRQFFNATLYGYLTNKNLEIINFEEARNYSSANMQIMVLLMIDLMASPSFRNEEIGLTRELFWNIQRMGRIGNSLTTLEREIKEGDYSSETFAYMISNNILKLDDLKRNKDYIVSKVEKKVKRDMLIQWDKRFQRIEEFRKKISFFNVSNVLDGTKELLINHLCSEGFK